MIVVAAGWAVGVPLFVLLLLLAQCNAAEKQHTKITTAIAIAAIDPLLSSLEQSPPSQQHAFELYGK